MTTPLQRLGRRHLVVCLVALLTLTAVGTVGYRMIEDLSLLDSLYMTVITLSTVGYGEVEPLSPAGRLFSIVLIMVGLGAALYTVGVVAEFFLEGRLEFILGERSMKRQIEHLEDHVILVGMGRFGRQVIRELADRVQLVVVENDSEKEAELERHGVHYVLGSALEEHVLLEAGIERARAIIVGTEDDSDNVFIVLNARDLNPEIRVHSRAESEIGARRLESSGADQVVLPHLLGGQRVANALMRPSVVDFIELSTPGSGAEMDLEEVLLHEESPLVGRSVESLASQSGFVVVALKHPGEPMIFGPSQEESLRAHDRLVVVGKNTELLTLSRTAAARG
ncbi:MAG: potassium channel protein [Acidobacteriota bacterium]